MVCVQVCYVQMQGNIKRGVLNKCINSVVYDMFIAKVNCS